MEIKDLILLMLRNIRYIIVGLALGASLGVFISKIQAPVYEASTKIFISRPRQQGNSDMLSLSDEQLLAINLQLAKSQPVLNDVSSLLGRKVDADAIQVGAIPNTLIIQIKVQDHDPQQAAAIANLLVQTLIQQNEILLSGRYTGFENAVTQQFDQIQIQMEGLETQIGQMNIASIQEQLTQISQQIEQLQAEISAVEQEIARFPYTPSPLERITLAEKQTQLDQLHSLMILYQQIQTNLIYIGKPAQNGSKLENPQLATLQSTLDIYQQINTALINSRENVRLARTQSRNNVMQIVSAVPPKNPVRPMPILYLLLGGVVGLALSATIILTLDHLNDSLKSAEQVEKTLGLPVLGYVSYDKYAKDKLITLVDPFSAEAEAFRSIGASLEIMGIGKNVSTWMIVNAEPTDERTTIAANLAVVHARQGKKVVLLDGDLKRSKLHNLFGMKNQKGFAEFMDGESDITSMCRAIKDVEGMTLVFSGLMEKKQTTWLDTERCKKLLFELQQQADVVIVDAPPANVADAQILASVIDAVLLTVRLGHTRIDSAQATLRSLRLIGAKVTGVVMNCTPKAQFIKKRTLPRIKVRPQGREDLNAVAKEADNVHGLST